MAGKVKTWVWVVVGVVIVCVLAMVAIAGVSLYYLSQRIETKAATPAAAAHDFEQVKARFAGQPALIELDERGRLVRTNTNRAAPANPKKPSYLYVLAFDPDSERIVNMSIPFWLLRLKTGDAQIELGGNRVDLKDLRLSVDDLERYGPTLIVDHKSREGERVLVWSQ
jgi:hypothetical protein